MPTWAWLASIPLPTRRPFSKFRATGWRYESHIRAAATNTVTG